MRHFRCLSTSLAVLMLVVAAAAAPAAAIKPRAANSQLDTAAIERATGIKGMLDPATGVFKVSIPRTDVTVRLAGATLSPRQGLTTWLAFQPAAEGKAILMGDLVLLAGELDPVVSAALDAGLDVTAIHNHFVGEEPRILYVHVDGHGAPDAMAAAAGRVLAAIGAAHGRQLPAVVTSPGAALEAKMLDGLLDTHGELAEGVYKATFADATSMHGERLGAAMGVNTWAAFAGTAEHAVVDGDFAMRDGEVRPVLVALRQAGISIVALHSHMVGEQPRIVFLHYWGNGAAAELAKGVRGALDAQRRARDAAERH